MSTSFLSSELAEAVGLDRKARARLPQFECGVLWNSIRSGQEKDTEYWKTCSIRFTGVSKIAGITRLLIVVRPIVCLA